MKNQNIVFLIFLTFCFNTFAQKGVRIGYIDMEYILQNVPNYTEAKNQLEQKAQTWKTELDSKKSAITKLQDALKTERVLLTKELIDEREEEIKFQETELSDYQQKRFGPNGDLIVQKTLLVQPVQDQVFTAVQDISEAKKYDFVFDKSSDLTMLFASKRFDISDQVLRVITRSSKRSQMNKKQIQEDEAKEKKLEEVEDNPGLIERQKIIDDKKLAREKLIADKKLLAEERKKEFDAKRQKLIDEKEAKKNGTVLGNDVNVNSNNNTTPKTETNNAINTAKDDAQKAREEKIAAQKAEFEARKKALEEKRLKTIADREAAKKAKLEGTVPKN